MHRRDRHQADLIEAIANGYSCCQSKAALKQMQALVEALRKG
ncbi:hypothetical protein [Rhodanobacter denitrificans]|uniref:Uncharacterized protein n=1 Tax=Rhodanobacter denitrificans TaxID=666685 RepID=M4NQR0_9GAMM|nr:hypothetical protein [Rhodanobacter denitrificans]AGG89931.1 hypothetical protein R2APBS1_2854 [Rhodanobacter denitrificans]